MNCLAPGAAALWLLINDELFISLFSGLMLFVSLNCLITDRLLVLIISKNDRVIVVLFHWSSLSVNISSSETETVRFTEIINQSRFNLKNWSEIDETNINKDY